MSLLDEATEGPVAANRCWAQKLDDDVAEEVRQVEDAYDDGVPINFAAMARGLKKLGVDITDVGRHMRRECKCRS